MILIKRIFFAFVALGLFCVAFVGIWAMSPIIAAPHAPIEFAVQSGSGVRSAAGQIVRAGVPVNPVLLEVLARGTGKGGRLKAGHYELKPGTTPMGLVDQLVRGEVAQELLTIIEGWTFRQMRQAIDAHPSIRHETKGLSDKELMQRISSTYTTPEGLFFPDTYKFAKGSSDLQIYKRAHALLLERLEQAWLARDRSLPYKSAYEALIMASIVEKETGQKSERGLIAAVFVNRLKRGMRLQTDPTVIYGMGERFDGNIRKRDLLADTPYNTYTRAGLPPTPIALPGAESLAAALSPADSSALYFVSRGNGTSHFSESLVDHNRAVRKYQQ